jgi:alginate O-acetyltransferase complex protein AlgI
MRICARLFGITAAAQLRLSVFFAKYRRVLAPLAHLAVVLVPGLCLHSPGRQSLREAPADLEHRRTFTISGLWHGANWTFVIWGLLNGLYFLPVLLRRRLGAGSAPARAEDARWTDLPAIALTFAMTLVAWVFFRAESLAHAGAIFRAMTDTFNLHALVFDAPRIKLLILAMVAIEWIQRRRAHPLEIGALPAPVRWAGYYGLAAAILLFGAFHHTAFIYFQF